MNVVFYECIDERRLLEEGVLTEGMKLIELHRIHAHISIDRRFQQEVLVALVGYELDAAMLKLIEILSPELLDKLFGVGFYLTFCTNLPGCALSSKISIAEILIGVVDQISLKTCLHQLLYIHRHEGQEGTQLVATFPLLWFRLEGDRLINRLRLFHFIISSQGGFHRCGL